MIKAEYSIKDQGYIYYLSCRWCANYELTKVRRWVRLEDPGLKELVEAEFPGWSIRDHEIICSACLQREREREINAAGDVGASGPSNLT
jgi:hypothetical protein